ncbi:MAG: hypothetical protein FWB79_01020 [Treponema sp.]|nr:hypothetical protein [Treponema sp.]
MRHFFLAAWLCAAALAQPVPVLPADGFPGIPRFGLLWAGSWERGETLHNRGDLGLAWQGLSLRAQVLDRRPLEFGDGGAWEGFSQGPGVAASLGLYHGATGSKALYGVLQEQGLPSRLRGPWSRAVPYAEIRRPTRADLRTAVSSTGTPEAYLRLSGPRLALSGVGGTLPGVSLRGFASAQVAVEGDLWPAFSGGLEASVGSAAVSLEGFFTGTRLGARESPTWFSESPSLPDRDFRLWAASLGIATPFFLFASDLALSSTFGYGDGLYGNAAIRLPFPGRWSLSLAAEGMGERYVGRGGVAHGGGLRVAGRIERRGPRGGLFRAETSLRAPALDAPFDRGSSGVSYRFPTPPAGAFPLRLSRVSLDAHRDASNPGRIRDGVDGTLGLSLNPPPVPLPRILLPPSGRSGPSPLGISLYCSLRGLGSTDGVPSPHPFFPADGREFDSLRVGCELRWSPGILQLSTRLHYEARSVGEGKLDGSVSVAIRFRRGRLGARLAWPEMPGKPDYTLSWRLEL